MTNYWYDADGERTVKTSGESDQVYVNSEFAGKDATVGEQITARFSDGSKVVFDNVVVKNGKVVLVNETKSGKATLSAQQKRFFKQNETVTFVGNKAERLGIKGAKVNASSTKTKISHVDVEEL